MTPINRDHSTSLHPHHKVYRISKPRYITLQPSEQTLVTAAATVYAAYVAVGRVDDGQETEWMKRSIEVAYWMTQTIDDSFQADKELS